MIRSITLYTTQGHSTNFNTNFTYFTFPITFENRRGARGGKEGGGGGGKIQSIFEFLFFHRSLYFASTFSTFLDLSKISLFYLQ
jgi:hypothetical protein